MFSALIVSTNKVGNFQLQGPLKAWHSLIRRQEHTEWNLYGTVGQTVTYQCDARRTTRFFSRLLRLFLLSLISDPIGLIECGVLKSEASRVKYL